MKIYSMQVGWNRSNTRHRLFSCDCSVPPSLCKTKYRITPNERRDAH